VNDEPTGVTLDPDHWILRQISEPLPEPPFDRGILLVNAVNFPYYGNEIRSAYADSVFWGDHPFSFWDLYEETAPGYPPNMPEPLGQGTVPADTLKQFSTLIWVSDGYGDEYQWVEEPIHSYLEAGGNVLLLTRDGDAMLNALETAYLGISWQPDGNISGAVSVYPGLVGMAGTHDYTSTIDTTLSQAESRLLFETGSGEVHGAGVWRKPADGGTYRTNGGQFVLICGHPYFWDHASLRANCQYILDHFFEEPYDPATGVAGGGAGRIFALDPNRPNPFNPTTRLSFQLPERGQASLRVYDVTGRLVATLAEGVLEAGKHAVSWEGTDAAGRRVASGIYFCRLASGEREASRKVVLLE
jgi:FlgD Ig-like domain